VADQDVEYFKPTSGRVVGILGVLGALALIVIVLLDGTAGGDLTLIWAATGFGVLVWASVLRPRVGVSSQHLVLRNLASTVTIPLGAVERLVVRQFLAVRVGGKRYVSPALGRNVRPRRRHAWPGSVPDRAPDLSSDPAKNYCDFVEERIRHRIAEVEPALGPPAPVVRRWAWPELIAMVVAATGLVVTLLR
jgi:hypothetical protein